MTTISSLSSHSYTSSYTSSLDTNGDGTVSAEELAAAKPKSISSLSSAPTGETSPLGSALEKFSAAAAELLLQIGSANKASGEDVPDPGEMLGRLDTNGDGALDADELAAGKPSGPPPGGAPPQGSQDETSDDSLAEGLTILQSIIQQYLENLGNTASPEASA